MLVITSSSMKAQEQTNPWLNILATIFSLEYYFFGLNSYMIILKLYTLVIIFFFTKAQKQTNPWLNILAIIFHYNYISLD